MTVFCKLLAVLLTLTLASAPHAQDRNARQNHAALRQAAEQFLRTQTNNLPGEVSITVGSIDRRINLPACAALEPFLAAGNRAWGKTTVGLRCTAPLPWTIHVTAVVRVEGDYVAAAVPLASGQSVGPSDIVKMKGDLTDLPAGVITDPSQAIGRTVTLSLQPGMPLRQDTLRAQQAVQQGQIVRLVTAGPGFRVSGEARALNNENDGQVTQARTNGGQVVSGIAKMGGIVEVTY